MGGSKTRKPTERILCSVVGRFLLSYEGEGLLTKLIPRAVDIEYKVSGFLGTPVVPFSP